MNKDPWVIESEKMKDENEKLSALLDDELDLRADATLDELLAYVNLKYRARRYQIIGEVLLRDLPADIDADFHHRVMAEISAEGKPVISNSHSAGSSSILDWLSGLAMKPIAGMAVAAAVAVVTVSLWQPQNAEQATSAESVASAESQQIQQYSQQQIAPVLPASTQPASKGMQWQVDRGSPELQNKLNSYLVNHHEYSNSVQGFIPQARVAGFDAE